MYEWLRTQGAYKGEVGRSMQLELASTSCPSRASPGTNDRNIADNRLTSAQVHKPILLHQFAALRALASTWTTQHKQHAGLGRVGNGFDGDDWRICLWRGWLGCLGLGQPLRRLVQIANLAVVSRSNAANCSDKREA